ncbi:hypothetical protein ACHQM5_004454 [Ranunculus cassubicifolius]
MVFSDDEDEISSSTQSVTTYHLENNKNEPISFSVLPILWREDEKPDSIKKEIFLKGIADDGIQKVYKQVTAWRFNLLEKGGPEIYVFSKDGKWIRLVKPRKSFEVVVRSVLVTVHCLQFVRKYPEASRKLVWEKLGNGKVISSYEVGPSENDLLDHLPLIKAAIKHDEALSKSKFLLTFEENPVKRKVFDEDSLAGLDADSKFIVSDDEESYEHLVEQSAVDSEGESDEETDLFDSVCAFCDNGGELLCCEGRCLRSFHPTVEDGEESDCQSLGFTKAEVKSIPSFMCLNCQHKKHQCFACGKLGSSDKSVGAEVFHCVSATCGYFYHPACVTKLLHPEDESEAEALKKRISEGESFTCPAHKCYKCNHGENKAIRELQFAVCRRCPKAYHRKCLPRKITFDDPDDEDKETRAWDDLLPNRILIYCLKHEIDEELQTPVRDHIKFPQSEEKNKARTLDLQKKRKAMIEDTEDDFLRERKITKAPKRASFFDFKRSGTTVKREKPDLKKDFEYSEILQIPDVSRKPLRDGMKTSKTFSQSEPAKSKYIEVSGKSKELAKGASPQRKVKEKAFVLDSETKKSLVAMMDEKASLITLEEVRRKYTAPSTHGYSSKSFIDKSITLGKIEGLVEAVRTAVQKLDKGGTIEDAQAVCAPDVINTISNWKNKLRVYLAPFIHGMRYTSFGRHFTKIDKLQEIVNILHWYAQDGDTIVDFCCGANDFSCLMNEKLEETGKKCSYRNFDVIQPKNDFCFEKRDWMSVDPKELPTGSKLIMGLNPPFGVKAALANKFINKALEFKPKLLILIVPPETERLDRKRCKYDLVWEDNRQLSGKSFYLPGSVDVFDNQMEQWNATPPPLYLWSRPDWTPEHKTIAIEHGHVPRDKRIDSKFSEDMDTDVDMDLSPARENWLNEKEEAKLYEIPASSPKALKSGESDRELQQYRRKPPRDKKSRRMMETEAHTTRSSLERGGDRPSETLTDRTRLGSNIPDPLDARRYNLDGHPIPEPLDARRYNADGPPTSYGTMVGLDNQFPGFTSQERETNAHTLVRRYGGIASETPTSYGLSGPGIDRGNSSSIMQRYEPRLDEMNHMRVNVGYGSQVRPTVGAGGMYDGGLGPQFGAGPPRPYPTFSGFAPGLRHPNPYQGGSGWIND